MKTGGMEVLCDGCGAPIKPLHPRAIFVTLRGPQVGHKKADVCDVYCLMTWARLLYERAADVRVKPA